MKAAQAQQAPRRTQARRPPAPLRVEVTIIGDRRCLAEVVGRACGQIWGHPALLATEQERAAAAKNEAEEL
jgi:hypothetical protein